MLPVKYISAELHKRLMGDEQEPIDEYQARQIMSDLASFGLDKAIDASSPIELPLLKGMASATDTLISASHYVAKAADIDLRKFAEMDVQTPPKFPSVPAIGWNSWDGQKWVQCEPPSNTVMVLDFETALIGVKWFPMCCVALTDTGNWLYWLADVSVVTALKAAIPFGKGNLIVAHNANYDRAYLITQYDLAGDDNLFFDTMSAVQAVRGFTSQQRPAYLAKDYTPQWTEEATALGLDDAYNFYTGKTLDKGERNLIVSQGIGYWRSKPQQGLTYCSVDVSATHELFSYVYPEFRNSIPALTSLGGMLLMSTEFLTLGERWTNYYTKVSRIYEDLRGRLSNMVIKVAEDTVNSVRQRLDVAVRNAIESGQTLDSVEIELDDWESQLDWTPLKSGANKGLPRWYAEFKNGLSDGDDVSLNKRSTSLLLKITFDGSPLVWDETYKGGGWAADGVPLPHPKKDGERVTSVFSKSFLELFKSRLASQFSEVAPLYDEFISATNWVSISERIKNTHPVKTQHGYHLVPQTDVVLGAVTRRKTSKFLLVLPNPKANRLGTEAKSMIEAPTGYKMVSFDIDSEELRLFALLGDTLKGVAGGTALSVSVLAGAKKDGTDTHSLVAKQLDMTRNDAKELVYGACYGLGDKGAMDYIRQRSKCAKEEAKQQATTFRKYMKGVSTDYGTVTGGIASESFNRVGMIANAPIAKTPILCAKISHSLRNTTEYSTTRFNWVIQSSGRDLLDCMLVLTKYLFDKYQIPARVMTTIHDSIHFLVKDGYTERVTYLATIAHKLTWAIIIKQYGLNTIPRALLYPECIEVDKYLRKSTTDDCITPSQTEPLLPYGVPYSTADILAAIGKGLDGDTEWTRANLEI